MARVVKPLSGEVVTIKGRIVARCVSRSGRAYLHLGPTGRGFPSKLSALEFINLTMREGLKVAKCVTSEDDVPAEVAPKATIFVKTINKPKLRREAHASLDPRPLAAHKRKAAKRANAERTYRERSDGVTRCSKCPPTTCCTDCARINKARQHAGLIRPKGDDRPHPNNCLPCIPHGHKYVGQRPMEHRNVRHEVTSIEVKPLGGGWYLGQAFLGLDAIYERKFRSRDKAREYAVNSLVDIKEGLKMEALLNG